MSCTLGRLEYLLSELLQPLEDILFRNACCSELLGSSVWWQPECAQRNAEHLQAHLAVGPAAADTCHTKCRRTTSL